MSSLAHADERHGGDALLSASTGAPRPGHGPGEDRQPGGAAGVVGRLLDLGQEVWIVQGPGKEAPATRVGAAAPPLGGRSARRCA